MVAMRHPREVAYYQYNRHGFREVLDVMRRNGICHCGANVPIMINAPFYHFSHLPYDPDNNRYDVTGYCRGCRKHVEASVRAELMPELTIDALARIFMDMDDEYCNHKHGLYMTHLVHEWEDSEMSDHFVVVCRRCKREIEIVFDDSELRFLRFEG